MCGEEEVVLCERKKFHFREDDRRMQGERSCRITMKRRIQYIYKYKALWRI